MTPSGRQTEYIDCVSYLFAEAIAPFMVGAGSGRAYAAAIMHAFALMVRGCPPRFVGHCPNIGVVAPFICGDAMHAPQAYTVRPLGALNYLWARTEKLADATVLPWALTEQRRVATDHRCTGTDHRCCGTSAPCEPPAFGAYAPGVRASAPPIGAIARGFGAAARLFGAVAPGFGGYAPAVRATAPLFRASSPMAGKGPKH